MRYIAIIVTLQLICGCVFPYPHNNWKTPKFVGVVTKAATGEVVSGAKVSYETAPEIYAISDVNGYYELAPQKEFEFLVVILPTAHPVPRIFNLVAASEEGRDIVKTGSCIGDPNFECNGRVEKVNFNLQ